MALNVRNVTQGRISYSLGEPSDAETKNTVIGLLKRIHSSSSASSETIDQLIDEIDDLQETKADKSTTYTKTEVDNALALKANQTTTYTKTEVDTNLALKADKSETYTKTQVDNALTLKANSNDVYTKTQVYTKTEVNNNLALKADKSETYTKTQVDNALTLKANSSDVYSKTQVDNDLALKADKSDTYTKTQVDNLINGSSISNYVTTDTTQIITGTKTFNELHSGSVYTPNFYLNNKLFNGALIKENDSSSDNEKICSKSYIEDMILNSSRSVLFNYYPISDNYRGGILTGEAYFRYYSDGTQYADVRTFCCSYFLDLSPLKKIWINGTIRILFNNQGSGTLFLDNIYFKNGSQYLFEAIPWNGTENYECGGFIEGEFWHSGMASPNRPLFHLVYLQKQALTGEYSYMFHYYKSDDVNNIGTTFYRDGRWNFHFKNFLMSHTYSP